MRPRRWITSRTLRGWTPRTVTGRPPTAKWRGRARLRPGVLWVKRGKCTAAQRLPTGRTEAASSATRPRRRGKLSCQHQKRGSESPRGQCLAVCPHAFVHATLAGPHFTRHLSYIHPTFAGLSRGRALQKKHLLSHLNTLAALPPHPHHPRPRRRLLRRPGRLRHASRGMSW